MGESEKRSKRSRPDNPRHSETRTQPEARVRGHSEVNFRGQSEAGARAGPLMPESGVSLWPGIVSLNPGPESS